jgi:nicotinamidase-related amidase
MKSQKCLLIIDMQKGSFTPETPRYETDSVVKKINSLATMFRRNSWLVAFVQHNGSALGEFIPNTHDWELLDELEVRENDMMVEKFANDVFYNTSFYAKLKGLNVNEPCDNRLCNRLLCRIYNSISACKRLSIFWW